MGTFLIGISEGNYFEVFEYYFGKFGSNTIELKIWLEFSIVLIIGFLVRGYLLIKFEQDKIKKDNASGLRKMKIYCINHTGYEFIIAYLICYVLINFTGANPNAFFVNAGICPGFSFLAGMVFDNKIIMKIEENSKFNTNPRIDPGEESNQEPIIIPTKVEENDSSENINIENTKIIDTINTIIDSNSERDNKIIQLSERVENAENIITILKETEAEDKKLEIKSLVYKCLNNGFATPEEDTIITNKYNLYMTLVHDADNEIKSLYNNRYLQLSVHKDRRKKNIEVENDRRRPKNINYGDFDHEEIIPQG